MESRKKHNILIKQLYTAGYYTLSSSGKKFYENVFEDLKKTNDIFSLGVGQIGYKGIPLKLFHFFDKTFLAFAYKYKATETVYPTIIPRKVLEKADYFSSFPKLATQVNNNHFLSPALCFHSYQQLQNQILKKSPVVITTLEKCFRIEDAYQSLERLWDFTMREIICIGTYKETEELRKNLIQDVVELADILKLEGLIIKTSDPFFTSESNKGKRIFQQLKPLKFELQLSLNKTNTLAVSSFNHHENFFGERFTIKLSHKEVAATSCIAFGLERWIYAFLRQYGVNPKLYPRKIKEWIEKND